MRNTSVLFVLVSVLATACSTGVTHYRRPVPLPMTSPTLAKGQNPCGLYLDPSGETGAYESGLKLDIIGDGGMGSAQASATTMDAAGRFMERCSNGAARYKMAEGFSEAWKNPFSSNPVWKKVGMGMDEAGEKENERKRVQKLQELYLKNVALLKSGKVKAEAAPAAEQPAGASPAPVTAPATQAASPSLGLRSKVAMATSLTDVAAALSAEAQKGGSNAAQYQSMADRVSVLPVGTDVQAEKSKILNVLP